MAKYKYISLEEIKKYEPQMDELKVSKVARSHDGFLSEYKRVGGNPDKLSESMQNKRNGFIARSLASYKNHKKDGHDTTRQRLSLIAWAYKP